MATGSPTRRRPAPVVSCAEEPSFILLLPYDSATSNRRSKASCALMMASGNTVEVVCFPGREEKGGNSKTSSSPKGNRGGIAFLLYQIPGRFPMGSTRLLRDAGGYVGVSAAWKGPFATAITSASSALIGTHLADRLMNPPSTRTSRRVSQENRAGC